MNKEIIKNMKVKPEKLAEILKITKGILLLKKHAIVIEKLLEKDRFGIEDFDQAIKDTYGQRISMSQIYCALAKLECADYLKMEQLPLCSDCISETNDHHRRFSVEQLNSNETKHCYSCDNKCHRFEYINPNDFRVIWEESIFLESDDAESQDSQIDPVPYEAPNAVIDDDTHDAFSFALASVNNRTCQNGATKEKAERICEKHQCKHDHPAEICPLCFEDVINLAIGQYNFGRPAGFLKNHWTGPEASQEAKEQFIQLIGPIANNLRSVVFSGLVYHCKRNRQFAFMVFSSLRKLGIWKDVGLKYSYACTQCFHDAVATMPYTTEQPNLNMKYDPDNEIDYICQISDGKAVQCQKCNALMAAGDIVYLKAIEIIPNYKDQIFNLVSPVVIMPQSKLKEHDANAKAALEQMQPKKAKSGGEILEQAGILYACSDSQETVSTKNDPFPQDEVPSGYYVSSDTPQSQKFLCAGYDQSGDYKFETVTLNWKEPVAFEYIAGLPMRIMEIKPEMTELQVEQEKFGWLQNELAMREVREKRDQLEADLSVPPKHHLSFGCDIEGKNLRTLGANRVAIEAKESDERENSIPVQDPSFFGFFDPGKEPAPKKPELGVMPRKFFEEDIENLKRERIIQVLDAIMKRNDNNDKIYSEWIKEVADYLKKK